MPILIQNIVTNITEVISSNSILNGIQNVNGNIHNSKCNHIIVPGYEAFVFDFSKVTLTETLVTDINYGLLYNNNKTFIDINISY